MKHLYFIRHGESEFNKANRWAGSYDTILTDTGHEQAKLAGQHAKRQGLKPDLIISSPLKRAHETAKYVASAVGYPVENITLDDRLVERSFGSLEGTRNLKASAAYLLDEAHIDRYEGAELLNDTQQRADELVAYLRTLPQDTILLVGHGAFGRALRRAVNKEPLHHRGQSYNNAEIVKLI